MAKVGDKIKVNPDLQGILTGIKARREDARTAFREAVIWMKDEDDRFWRAVFDAHPELKGSALIYNDKSGELMVVSPDALPDVP